MASISAIPLKDTTLVLADDKQRELVIGEAVTNWNVPKGVDFKHGVKNAATVNGSAAGQDGRCLYWVLVPRSDTHTLDVLSSTRTFKRDAKILSKGKDSVEAVASYVITSVITPEQHRKRGYGRHILRLLHYTIALPSALPPFPTDTWGEPPTAHFNDATYSTLWSDVGRDFYRLATIGDGELARDGWVAVFDGELNATVGPSVVGSRALEACLASGWKLVTELPSPPSTSIVDQYETSLLQNQLKSPSISHAIVDSLSSPGLLAFNPLKASIATPVGLEAKNEHYGLIKGSSWVYYSATWKPTAVLSIAHMHLEDLSELPSILDMLHEYAARLNCKNIVAYEVEEQVAEGWKQRGATVKHRDDHIGALAWYGEGPVNAVKLVGGEGYAVA